MKFTNKKNQSTESTNFKPLLSSKLSSKISSKSSSKSSRPLLDTSFKSPFLSKKSITSIKCPFIVILVIFLFSLILSLTYYLDFNEITKLIDPKPDQTKVNSSDDVNKIFKKYDLLKTHLYKDDLIENASDQNLIDLNHTKTDLNFTRSFNRRTIRSINRKKLIKPKKRRLSKSKRKIKRFVVLKFDNWPFLKLFSTKKHSKKRIFRRNVRNSARRFRPKHKVCFYT